MNNKHIASFLMMAFTTCINLQAQKEDDAENKKTITNHLLEYDYTIDEPTAILATYKEMPDEYFGYYDFVTGIFVLNKKAEENGSLTTDINEYSKAERFLVNVLNKANLDAFEIAAEEMVNNDGFAIKKDNETGLFKIALLDKKTKSDLKILQKNKKTACIDHPWAFH